VNTGRSNRWRRVFHWPLFCILGVAHHAVLPQLASEHADVATVAGVAYLGLAAADWRYRTRVQAVGSQSGRVRS